MSQRHHSVAVYTDEAAVRAAMVCCARRQMTLTHAGCVRLFNAANGAVAPHVWDGVSACRGCPVGAARAGKRAAVPVIHPILGTCPRCLRPASRLIWDRLCASCDARAREAKRGRTSRGGRPGVLDRLAERSLVIRVEGRPVEIRSFGPTVGLVEAWLAAARHATGAARFSTPAFFWPVDG
jgi:hypothetical protein